MPPDDLSLNQRPRWFWLSFADAELPKGEQFLGACLVKAVIFPAAIEKAHRLGINPGGEVQGMELDDDAEPLPGWDHRLLTRAECEQFDAAHSAL